MFLLVREGWASCFIIGSCFSLCNVDCNSGFSMEKSGESNGKFS